jgi:small nuclear ribonucleoprotein (snRNP)-like protein
MNIVLEDAVDQSPNVNAEADNSIGTMVVRGNNILQFELVN